MDSKNRTISLLLTGSNQTMYTCPQNYEAEISSILVTNAAGALRSFSLDWIDTSATATHTVAELVELEAYSLLQIEESLWLEQGDSIQALASATSSVTVTLRIKEYFIPKQF